MTPGLQKAVRDEAGIAVKATRDQFEKPLLQPLQSLERSKTPMQTLVIVIDPLDNCEGDIDIRHILQLPPQLQMSSTVRLQVPLTSRPKVLICLGFSKMVSHDHKDLILYNIPKEATSQDISLFLKHRLSNIRHE